METLTLFNIEVLKFDSVDVLEESIQYNDVEFCITSLREYNGKCVQITDDWLVRIWSDEGEVEKEFFLIENDEFRQKLYAKYPL